MADARNDGPWEMKDPIRLLVVEDDPGHVALLERMLRRAGIVIDLVVLDDGAAALDHLRAQHDPTRDVMLLDLRLPRMDGMTLLRELRTDPLFEDLPVIVTSTTLDSEEEAACHALGCDRFLLKPIRHDAFLEALRGLGITPLLDVPDAQGRTPDTKLQ